MTMRSIACGACGADVPHGRLSCPACGELLASVSGSLRGMAALAPRPDDRPLVDALLDDDPEPVAAAPEAVAIDDSAAPPSWPDASTESDADDDGGLMAMLDPEPDPGPELEPGADPDVDDQPEADAVTPEPAWPADAVTPEPAWPADAVTSEPAWPTDAVTPEPAWPADAAAAQPAWPADAVDPGPAWPADRAPSWPAPPPDPEPALPTSNPSWSAPPPGAYLPPTLAPAPTPPAILGTATAAAAVPAGPAAPARAWAGAHDGSSSAEAPSTEGGQDAERLRVDEAIGWVAVGGGTIALLGFLIPWARTMIGSGGDGYIDQWGLAGPGHLVIVLALVGILAGVLIPNRIPAWLRLGVPGLIVGAILIGLVWPYVLGPLGALPGAFLSLAGALTLVGASIASIGVDRHARHRPTV